MLQLLPIVAEIKNIIQFDVTSKYKKIQLHKLVCTIDIYAARLTKYDYR